MNSPLRDSGPARRRTRLSGRRRWAVLGATIAVGAVVAAAAPGPRAPAGAADRSRAVVDHRGMTDDECASCHRGDHRGLLRVVTHRGFLCTRCHATHGSSNLHLVRERIQTPNSGLRDVVFTAYTGPNSFADGDAVYDGVCEVCHTTTLYHRNDPSGDHAHNVAADCRACHIHADGYAPSGGSCLDCHDKTQPHQAGDYRRQVVERAGDGGGDFVRTSHHVTDGTTNQVVTAADCVVCHDQSAHRTFSDGVSVLLKDPAGGSAILYDGTATSLEEFCTACHDGTHGAPFSDGRPAPTIRSDWTGSPHQTGGVTCFGDGTATGCHANAHGSDRDVLLQRFVSLQDYTTYAAAEYDLCWLCHSEQHIIFEENAFEDLHDKHVRGEDAPCATCHDMHHPHDPGESLIDFSYAVDNGFDLQLIDGRDLSSAFWISGDKGYCYLKCHGETHDPKDYTRPGGTPPTSAGGAGPAALGRIRGFPVPTEGGATVLVELASGGAARADATIHDVHGRVVRRLDVELPRAGQYTVAWDGRDDSGTRVQAGVYLFRLTTGSETRTCKLVVLR